MSADSLQVETTEKKRWPLIVGPLVGVAVIGITVASLVVNSGPEGEKIRVTDTLRADVTSRVLAQGKVRARRQVEVGSEITGRVEEVTVEVGDVVKTGDPLFALDAEQLRNTVSQLRIALRAAQAMQKRSTLMLQESERNLGRDTKLKERGVVSGDVLQASLARVELARADVQSAAAQVDRARLELARADDALGKTRVLAPIDGTVVAVNVEVGQVAAPTAGLSSSASFGMALPGLGGGGDPSAAVVIADLSELLARLDVDELDILQVKLQQTVKLTAQGQEAATFEGEVSHVGLMGRDLGGSVQFPVEATVFVGDKDDASDAAAAASDGGPAATAKTPSEVPTPPAAQKVAPEGHGLRPGMSVSAQIEVQKLNDAISIPVAAVLEGDGREGGEPDRVLVVDDGITGTTVKEVPVVLGPTDGDIVAVLEGLEEDQKIVEGPFRTLRSLSDGDTVQIDEEVPHPRDPEKAKKDAARKKKKKREGKGEDDS
jgi:macrolide-specific efflux system membrane fusion protein